MLLPYTTLTYYGPGAAAMSLEDGIGVGTLDVAEPHQTKRFAMSIVSTGTAQVLRPYRGYAAELAVEGVAYAVITPHQTIKVRMVVDVGAAPSASDIAQAVWNGEAATFNYANTMGNKLNSAASGGVDYSALGAAVWNVLTADMNTTGSAGMKLKAILSKGEFLALKD
jgi:hypothetical protein